MTAEIVVIGAGISGALAAEELTDAGFYVIVLDRRGPGLGSTLATTALLQYEIDIPLCKLIRKIGFEKAACAWRRSKLGIESLSARTRILGIECGLQRMNSLYLNGDILDEAGLEKERELRNQIGLQTGFLTKVELKERKLKAAAALESYDNFSANPYEICRKYLKTAIERGAEIFAPVDVTDISCRAHGVEIRTKDGFAVKARHAVFATGYEIPKQWGKQKLLICSTWAYATKKQKKGVIPPDMPLIWQASDPYLYIRSTPDGRFICGGEDEKHMTEDERNALTGAKVAVLQRKLAKLMPQIDTTAEYAWSGSFGLTPTGLPLIGAVPNMPNCYAVLAFGGNGITFSRIGAEIIRGALTGESDPDEDLFAFTTPG